VRVQVRFVGKVQGVGFRATTRSIARKFPVTGWVRNEPDGSVLMQAQGASHDVHAMLSELRAQMARNIKGEQEIPMDVQPGEQGFDIAR
jgi:acylphosphatase